MSYAAQVDQKRFKVPENIEELRKFLQAAMEVEHLTIPVYMTGMYTIHPGANSEAYYAIRSVLLEEMLHMTLAANLLNAVGGSPRVAHPEFLTSYPAKLPMSDESLPEIGLQHFSEDALNTFLVIEKPQSFDHDAEQGSGWTSIGQFYHAIEQGLLHLINEKGEAEVFTGSLSEQVGPEDFYNSGGEAFAVKDRASALKALRTISEQGEGAHGSIWDSDDELFGEERQPAHYFRFNEILKGQRYKLNDTPDEPPSGSKMKVAWDEVYPIRGESRIADYQRYQSRSVVYEKALEFNEVYARLLSYLEGAFTGCPALMAAAVPTMLELRDRAEQLYRNPHPNPEYAEQGYFASATFEITKQQFEQAKVRVAEFSAAAGLEPGEPIDLSGITAESGEQFA